MTEPRSKFSQDLDRLELTNFRQAYGWALEDLYKILNEELTPENGEVLLRIATRMNAMESLRFPAPNTEN